MTVMAKLTTHVSNIRANSSPSPFASNSVVMDAKADDMSMLAFASITPALLLHHRLCHLEDGNDKVKGMADDIRRDSRLDNPLKEDECIEIVHVVLLHNHVNQLIGQDRGNNKARDGNNHRL